MTTGRRIRGQESSPSQKLTSTPVTQGQGSGLGFMTYALLSRKWTTDDERQNYNKRKLFPLAKLASSGRAGIILKDGFKPTIIDSQSFSEGVFGEQITGSHSVIEGSEERPFDTFDASIAANSNTKSELLEPKPAPIVVRTKLQLIISPLHTEDGYIYDIYDIAEKLARRLRDSPMTDAHLKDSKAGKDTAESVKKLKQEMKDMTGRALEEDERSRMLYRLSLERITWTTFDNVG